MSTSISSATNSIYSERRQSNHAESNNHDRKPKREIREDEEIIDDNSSIGGDSITHEHRGGTNGGNVRKESKTGSTGSKTDDSDLAILDWDPVVAQMLYLILAYLISNLFFIYLSLYFVIFFYISVLSILIYQVTNAF